MFSEILNLTISFILAFFVSWVAFEKGFLSKSGSIATFFLAMVIFYFGGIKWSVPVLTFFIPSSLLSKLNHSVKRTLQGIFEKSSERDFWQVAANGAVGGVLVLIDNFFPDERWFLLYVSYFAIMSADTWATELGTLRRRKTYNVLTFEPVKQGISGGVSFFGLGASILGAAVVSFSALPWLNGNFGIALLLTVTGLLGSLIDSILGATIQVQYRCVNCSVVTERNLHCNTKTKKIKGVAWFNNDWVNFTAGVIGILIFYLIETLIA